MGISAQAITHNPMMKVISETVLPFFRLMIPARYSDAVAFFVEAADGLCTTGAVLEVGVDMGATTFGAGSMLSTVSELTTLIFFSIST
jgi:hypothetical protein